MMDLVVFQLKASFLNFVGLADVPTASNNAKADPSIILKYLPKDGELATHGAGTFNFIVACRAGNKHSETWYSTEELRPKLNSG